MQTAKSLLMVRFGWLLILAAMFFTGCGSVRIVSRDKAFDAAAVRQAGIAVASVTRLDIPDYYAERSVANVVAAHLQEAGFRAVKIEQVAKTLSESARGELKRAFYELSEVNSTVLEKLEPLREQSRFVLMMSILREDAPSYAGVHGEVMEDRIHNPNTGETYVLDHGVRYTSVKGSYRSIEALFVLIDLELGKAVLVARGEATEGFANSSSDVNWVPRVSATGNPTPSDLFETLGEDFAKLLR